MIARYEDGGVLGARAQLDALKAERLDIVRCGGAGAVWRIASVNEGEGVGAQALEVLLEPVDPHDVPLTTPVFELPHPSRRLEGRR